MPKEEMLEADRRRAEQDWGFSVCKVMEGFGPYKKFDTVFKGRASGPSLLVGLWPRKEWVPFCFLYTSLCSKALLLTPTKPPGFSHGMEARSCVDTFFNFEGTHTHSSLPRETCVICIQPRPEARAPMSSIDARRACQYFPTI